MSEKTSKFEYIKKLSTFKKVLAVFVALLIFIIIVEQPGSDASKRRKKEKFFLPKLVVEEVGMVNISNPKIEAPLKIEKKEGKWRIANGHSFPADENKVQEFLKTMHSLKQGSLVSKNPDRTSIFSADEDSGINIKIWDNQERDIADFYAGELIPNGQYLRHTDSDEVYQAIPSLAPYLLEDLEGWKDKTLLVVSEEDVHRIAIKTPEKETVIEKNESGEWNVIQPEEYIADSLAIRTLFDQLKLFKADSFADSVDASQVDFENPDYKISVRLNDDSLKLVSLSESEEGDKYYAKNGESTFSYIVSKELLEKVFGLEFKTESEELETE